MDRQNKSRCAPEKSKLESRSGKMETREGNSTGYVQRGLRLLSAAAVAAVAAALPAHAVAAVCIWFADTTSIKRVDTDFNSVAAEVPLGAPPRRLVMNDNDCSVWALRESDKHL